MSQTSDVAPLGLELTTNPGLEAVVRAEVGERIGNRLPPGRGLAFPPATDKGRVPVDLEATTAELQPMALQLRAIHHVIRRVTAFTLPADGALAAIREHLAATPIPGLTPTTPFRVSSVRSGVHDFTSVDVQAAAGAGLQAGTGAPVNLRDYAVHVQVDVIGARCLVGVRWSDRPLSRRFARPYERRVALAANVAYALLRLAAIGRPPRRLLDPCCGTGTILLEAGCIHADTQLVGRDSDPRSVAGAAQNLAAYGLGGRSRTSVGDARALGELRAEAPFDAIVTNPPFGRRLGRRIDFRRFYRELLTGAREIIADDGRLVLLADRRGLFNAACRDAGGWHIRDVRIVELGGIHPGIYVLTPI